jgi:hypothetical protein
MAVENKDIWGKQASILKALKGTSRGENQRFRKENWTLIARVKILTTTKNKVR